MTKIRFDKKGSVTHQKITYDVKHDEETTELIEILKKQKEGKRK